MFCCRRLSESPCCWSGSKLPVSKIILIIPEILFLILFYILGHQSVYFIRAVHLLLHINPKRVRISTYNSRISHFWILTVLDWGTWRRSCLRHCATRRKIAGSILDGVFVLWVSSASNRYDYQEGSPWEGGKVGRCVGLTT